MSYRKYQIKQKDRLIVHLVDYSVSTETPVFDTNVSSELGRVHSAKLMTIGDPDKPLNVQQTGSVATVQIDKFKVYGAVIVDFEK